MFLCHGFLFFCYFNETAVELLRCERSSPTFIRYSRETWFVTLHEEPLPGIILISFTGTSCRHSILAGGQAMSFRIARMDIEGKYRSRFLSPAYKHGKCGCFCKEKRGRYKSPSRMTGFDVPRSSDA